MYHKSDHLSSLLRLFPRSLLSHSNISFFLSFEMCLRLRLLLHTLLSLSCTHFFSLSSSSYLNLILHFIFGVCRGPLSLAVLLFFAHSEIIVVAVHERYRSQYHFHPYAASSALHKYDGALRFYYVAYLEHMQPHFYIIVTAGQMGFICSRNVTLISCLPRLHPWNSSPCCPLCRPSYFLPISSGYRLGRHPRSWEFPPQHRSSLVIGSICSRVPMPHTLAPASVFIPAIDPTEKLFLPLSLRTFCCPVPIMSPTGS